MESDEKKTSSKERISTNDRSHAEAVVSSPSPTSSSKAKALTKSGKLTREERLAEMKQEVKMEEHLMSADEVIKKFNTHPENGLSPERRQELLREFGRNELSPPKTIPEWRKFLKELTGWFSILLLVGGILSFIGFAIQADKSDQSNLYIGVVLVAVVLVTAIFSYMQNRKADNTMKKFKNFLPSFAICIVDGEITKVGVEELVPGDIVRIEAGNKIPADIRLLESFDVRSRLIYFALCLIDVSFVVPMNQRSLSHQVSIQLRR